MSVQELESDNSFSKLNDEISSTTESYISLTKNYNYNSSTDNQYKNGIELIEIT